MLANLIGPLLAGLLYSAIGKAYLQDVRIIFWGCAICFFSAAILEAFIKIPKITLTPISNPLHAIKKDLGESFYLQTNVNNLTQATTTYCVFLLIGTGFPVPFFIQDHYLN